MTLLHAACLATAVSVTAFGTSAEQDSWTRGEVVVLDVLGDGLCFVPPSSEVRLRLTMSGPVVASAWTCRGSDDAFVILDRNSNGRIDSLEEIVGGGTLGPPNGLDFLAIYDGRPEMSFTPSSPSPKPDGKLDATDGIFSRLVMWTDGNHDAAAQEDELQSLAYAGFDRLELRGPVLPITQDVQGILTTRKTMLYRRDGTGSAVYTIRLALAPGRMRTE